MLFNFLFFLDYCVFIYDENERCGRSWLPCSICERYNVQDDSEGLAGWNSREIAESNCAAWSDCAGFWVQNNTEKYWAMESSAWKQKSPQCRSSGSFRKHCNSSTFLVHHNTTKFPDNTNISRREVSFS